MRNPPGNSAIASGGLAARLAVFFTYGFRPFFLLAGLAAPLALSTLIAGLGGAAWPADALPLFRWHGHEMLFGFVAAAIAGFLLTAAPTWTSTAPVSGNWLAALAGLWVVGRIVLSPVSGLGATPVALLEALFLLALMAALAGPLIRTRNLRNYPLLLVLALLFAADALFHAQQLGWIAQLPFDPLRVAANFVLLMIVIVGGRIIPAFTRNALVMRGAKSTIAPAPRLEKLSIAAVVAVVAVDLFAADSAGAGLVAAVAAALLAMRLAQWEGLRTLRMPIVFVLHAGYAWLVAALALKAMWLLAGSPWAANWLHALTAGAFGTMILAVATRVALGHTGRTLVASPAIVVAYVLVTAGALLRVFGGVVMPAYYLHALVCATALWSAAFVIFLLFYFPILTGPRANPQ